MSLESNKEYRDSSQWFQKVIYLYPADAGRTWGDAVVVSRDASGRLFNWGHHCVLSAPGGQRTDARCRARVGIVRRHIARRHHLELEDYSGGGEWLAGVLR